MPDSLPAKVREQIEELRTHAQQWHVAAVTQLAPEYRKHVDTLIVSTKKLCGEDETLKDELRAAQKELSDLRVQNARHETRAEVHDAYADELDDRAQARPQNGGGFFKGLWASKKAQPPPSMRHSVRMGKGQPVVINHNYQKYVEQHGGFNLKKLSVGDKAVKGVAGLAFQNAGGIVDAGIRYAAATPPAQPRRASQHG